MLMEIAPTLGTALLGVTALFLVGKVALSWVFDLVMSTRSHDAFVALCLLTVCGTSVVTTSIGLSDTLGAFLAGVLLAETNFRSQVGFASNPPSHQNHTHTKNDHRIL
jgi:Kef-type K+ transport system membrane component KefB